MSAVVHHPQDHFEKIKNEMILEVQYERNK